MIDSGVGMTDGLRIAMVIQRFRPNFSGQGIQVEAIAKALVRCGVEVSIITATSGTDRLVETCEGYSVIRVGSDPPPLFSSFSHSRLRGPLFAARTFGYLQTLARFDLVHVHAMTDALYPIYVWCRLHEKPLLFEMTLVGADDPFAVAQNRYLFSSFRRNLYGRCDGYVAISPALEKLSHEAGLPKDRVQLIPQGVDIDLFRPVSDRMSVRRDLGIPTDGPLLTFVGSLVYRKGFDVLLDAWSQIHQIYPTARLLLVGRDEFEKNDSEQLFLSSQLAQVPIGAAARMHRTGVREDVHRFLQASDLFLFPSRREGFGSVMVEAMSCGLPSVVTELPGITDFIFSNKDTGIVVEQGDARSLSEQALKLLRDPDAAARMGTAARANAIDRFDINMLAGRYINYYRSLIAGTGVRGVL